MEEIILVWLKPDLSFNRFTFTRIFGNYRNDDHFLQAIGIENFRKAFGDVLLYPARNLNCSFDSDYSNLKLSFSLPEVNPDLRVFHAEVTDLTERFQDYTCLLKYNGTENVVWSTEQNCIVAKDLADPRASYLITSVFTQSNSCLPIQKEEKPYFNVSACYQLESLVPWNARRWQLEQSFSYKWINRTFYYNYCNGGFVNYPTRYNSPIPCPPFVFRTPSSPEMSVEVENETFSTRFFSNIDDTVLPASITINKMLFPDPLNTTAILMSQIQFPIRRETTKTFVYPPTAILAMFIIIGSMISLIILGALLYLFRKFGVISHNVNKVVSIKFWKNQIQTI